MSEYLAFVISATAVVTFGGFMMYGGAQSKASRAALGVILLSVTVIPVVDSIDAVGSVDLSALFEDVEMSVGEDVFYKTAEEAFAEGIRKMICDEFDVDADNVVVRVFGFELEKMRAEKINVILSGTAAYIDSRAVVARVREGGLGECEVKIEF